MLNGATLNGSRLNVWSLGVQPVVFEGDAVAEVASILEATRYAFGDGDAVAVASAAIGISAQRWFGGDLLTENAAEVAVSMVRGGSGDGVISIGGSLFYTRLILGSGGAEIQIIAISDVGVVYGEGSGVSSHFAEIDVSRKRTGFGDSAAETFGELYPAAIRIPATADVNNALPLIAQLDSAHVTAGGIRYINGFSDAIAYLDIEDDGFRRQVFIGTLDLEPIATGFATATRNGRGDAVMQTGLDMQTRTVRRGQGSGVLVGAAALDGGVFVRGEGEAVVQLVAQMTGYAFRRTGVLQAISTIAAELVGVRLRLGLSSAPLVCVLQGAGQRAKAGDGVFVIELNAASTAQDFNFAGMDDDTELFYRPAMQREFARPAATREWRRA